MSSVFFILVERAFHQVMFVRHCARILALLIRVGPNIAQAEGRS
jgi:hypothetical protein